MIIAGIDRTGVYKSRYADMEHALFEQSLARVWQHSREGYFTISAFKGNEELAHNMAQHEKLKKDTKAAGLGFFEIDGAYVYRETGDRSAELSLFVPFKEGVFTMPEFRAFALQMGKKYKQESVMFFHPDEGGIYLYSNGKEEKIGSVASLDQWKEYWSALRENSQKGRSYVVEGCRIPSNVASAQMLDREGMLF